jgi:hypothetical protein
MAANFPSIIFKLNFSVKYLPMQKAAEEQFKIPAVALSQLRLTPEEQRRRWQRCLLLLHKDCCFHEDKKEAEEQKRRDWAATCDRIEEILWLLSMGIPWRDSGCPTTDFQGLQKGGGAEELSWRIK